MISIQIMTMLSLCGAVMMAEVNAPNEWCTTTKVEGTSILLEEQGKVAMIYDHWTIVTVIERSDNELTTEFLNNVTQLTRSICYENDDNNTKKHFNHNCEAALETIEQLSKRITDWGGKIDLLMEAQKFKRAIEPLGSFIKWACGNPDADDARKLQEQIKQAERNNKVTFHMAKQQITLISSTLQGILKPLKTLESEHEGMKIQMEKLEEMIRDQNMHAENSAQRSLVRTSINSFIEAISLKIQEIALIRSDEILTLDAMMNGIFHHNLVDLQLMKKQFSTLINDKQNKYLNLAQPPYGMIKVEHYTSEGKVYVKLTVPMANEEVLKMEKVYPVLQPIGNGWSKIIQVEENWLACDDMAKSCVTFKDENKKCQWLRGEEKEKIQLCEADGAISTTSGSECLKAQMMSKEMSENNCAGKIIPTPGVWLVKMAAENKWLFTVKEETKIKAFCRSDKKIREKTISGTGYFQINEPCDVDIHGSTIRYSRKITSFQDSTTVTKGKEIQIEIPTWITKMSASVKRNRYVSVKQHHEMSEAVSEAVERTNELERQWDEEEMKRRQQEQSTTVERHEWSLWSIMGGTLITLGIGITALCWVCRYKSIIGTATRELGTLSTLAIESATGASRNGQSRRMLTNDGPTMILT